MQLRESRKRAVNPNYPAITFGDAKGLTFEKDCVIIYIRSYFVEIFRNLDVFTENTFQG